MTITTLSSRAFNQHSSDAKKATAKGPVFITDRGRPAHVLLSIEQYRELSGSQITLGHALAQADVEDFEFDPPQVGGLYRAPDLS